MDGRKFEVNYREYWITMKVIDSWYTYTFLMAHFSKISEFLWNRHWLLPEEFLIKFVSSPCRGENDLQLCQSTDIYFDENLKRI